MASKKAAEVPEVPELRSPCPIAGALDVLGDRWTLLVVRDLLLFGKRRYGELADSPEGIPTNLLAERLRRLLAHGLVDRQPYQERPSRYEYQLTEKGRDLMPVLLALVTWGQRHVPGVHQGPPPPSPRRASQK